MSQETSDHAPGLGEPVVSAATPAKVIPLTPLSGLTPAARATKLHIISMARGQRSAAEAIITRLSRELDLPTTPDTWMVLRAIEWEGGTTRQCPMCQSHQAAGHTEECDLAAAIRGGV